MSIEISNVSFAYDGRGVLQEVSFSVPQGKLTVLLGRNGCGKSTLMKLVAGMLAPREGSIRVLARDVASLSGTERARLIGYLPQFHNPVFPFTVEDVVLTGRAAFVWSLPTKRDMEHAGAAISAVGIDHLRGRPYNELSGGERQLVLIARVLAQEPRVVLLDEPSSHLDLANQAALMKVLRGLADSGLTVLAVLHDPNAAFLYADEFFFLRDGRTAAPAEGLPPWDPSFLSSVYGTQTASIPFRDRALVVAPPRPFEG